MSTSRATILKEALELFNEYGELVSITLAELRAEDQESPPPWIRTPQDKDDEYHLFELIRLLADGTAATSAKRRTRIGTTEETPETWAATSVGAQVVRHFKAMSKTAQADLMNHWKRIEESSTGKKQSQALKSEEYDLDRYYSREIVDKLPLIIGRASQLSPVRVNTQNPVPADVERYFSEAHQCYLYGFPVACAVLCRAILEAALKMRVRGKLEDLADYIEAAHERGALSQERRVWAYEVKDAGNNAIHQYERFARGDLNDRVAECLTKTRAIVEELFSVRNSASAGI